MIPAIAALGEYSLYGDEVPCWMDFHFVAVFNAEPYSHRWPQRVSLLYRNLYGADPSAADLAYLAVLIDSGKYTPVRLARAAAELKEDRSNVRLDALVETGCGIADGSYTVSAICLGICDAHNELARRALKFDSVY